MKTKYEITSSMIEKYLAHLDSRIAGSRAEIAKHERHIRRLESRKANPEPSLRAELAEGSIGVFKAVGLEVPKKVKDEAPKEVPRNHGMMEQLHKKIEEEVPKKKTEWEDF